MAAIALPAYNTVKKNIVTILQAVSAAEVVAGNPGFSVERDRYKNWDGPEDGEAKVNVILASLSLESGGSQKYTTYRATFNIDMYVLSAIAEDNVTDDILIPANVAASDRLDLLIEQVRFGLTQMAQHNFGMPSGMISRSSNGMNLTISNQSDGQSVGVFAPARWVLELLLPYSAADNGATAAISGLTVAINKALEDITLSWTYPAT